MLFRLRDYYMVKTDLIMHLRKFFVELIRNLPTLSKLLPDTATLPPSVFCVLVSLSAFHVTPMIKRKENYLVHDTSTFRLDRS